MWAAWLQSHVVPLSKQAAVTPRFCLLWGGRVGATSLPRFLEEKIWGAVGRCPIWKLIWPTRSQRTRKFIESIWKLWILGRSVFCWSFLHVSKSSKSKQQKSEAMSRWFSQFSSNFRWFHIIRCIFQQLARSCETWRSPNPWPRSWASLWEAFWWPASRSRSWVVQWQSIWRDVMRRCCLCVFRILLCLFWFILFGRVWTILDQILQNCHFKSKKRPQERWPHLVKRVVLLAPAIDNFARTDVNPGRMTTPKLSSDYDWRLDQFSKLTC